MGIVVEHQKHHDSHSRCRRGDNRRKSRADRGKCVTGSRGGPSHNHHIEHNLDHNHQHDINLHINNDDPGSLNDIEHVVDHQFVVQHHIDNVGTEYDIPGDHYPDTDREPCIHPVDNDPADSIRDGVDHHVLHDYHHDHHPSFSR